MFACNLLWKFPLIYSSIYYRHRYLTTRKNRHLYFIFVFKKDEKKSKHKKNKQRYVHLFSLYFNKTFLSFNIVWVWLWNKILSLFLSFWKGSRYADFTRLCGCFLVWVSHWWDTVYVCACSKFLSFSFIAGEYISFCLGINYCCCCYFYYLFTIYKNWFFF